MVKIKWKLEREKLYLAIYTYNYYDTVIYYWFPKKNTNKRFHPKQIFTRDIEFTAYRDGMIRYIVSSEGWKEDTLSDNIVESKLGLCMSWI